MTNNRVYYNDVEHQEKVAIHRGRPVENKLVGMEMAKPPVDFANLARSFSLHGEGRSPNRSRFVRRWNGRSRSSKKKSDRPWSMCTMQHV